MVNLGQQYTAMTTTYTNVGKSWLTRLHGHELDSALTKNGFRLAHMHSHKLGANDGSRCKVRVIVLGYGSALTTQQALHQLRH